MFSLTKCLRQRYFVLIFGGHMKKLIIVLSLIVSTAAFAKPGDVCNPGKKVLEKAALTLAKINNPEGELSVQLAPYDDAEGYFKVIVDDNYGYYDTIIVTQESSNGFCRIISISEAGL